MKMLQASPAGDSQQEGNSGGRNIVVGVKMDSESRELLTWALVKVARPGDAVVALHVLGNNEIVDRDGKSSLLSLVKAFDTVHAVYEGFCNLKQVDLKLKICRGSSIGKVLVREANAYSSTHVIVGIARSNHKIWSSISVAKYCAKKLPKDCWVLAVNNGKVVFKKEGSPGTAADLQGIACTSRNGLLNSIHRTFTRNSKVLNEGNAPSNLKHDKGNFHNSEKSLAMCFLDSEKQNCSICPPDSSLEGNSCHQSQGEPPIDSVEENSLSLVPVHAKDLSASMANRELPELKPGWPLLGRTVSSHGHFTKKLLVRQISVVEWAMRLPHRGLPSILDHKQDHMSKHGQDQSPALDSQSGAIVPIDGEPEVSSITPEHDDPLTLPEELKDLQERYSSTCRLYSYQELASATSNFMPENLIGKGGSSQVYRGCRPDGKELAVKILKPSEEVLKEFLLEIEILTNVHHKNIICLLGFCFEGGKLLLVYDFLSRGSLEENLHGDKKDPLAFGWSERFKVAVGLAEALDYLHTRNARPVIHRDVKSSNVLLSDDFEPQLSDFGLAKWASTSSSHITCTDVAGTFGYLAPEYFMYGKVNEKIDVYAFGVVLLELLSGRKPISDDCPKGQESLVMWAKPILDSGKVLQLLDPNLGNNFDQEQMERMVLAATLCVRRAPRARPHMNLVLKLLQGDADVKKWAKLEVNACEGQDTLDDEACPPSNLQSHLNLALLDVEDDSLSMSSIEQNVSLEDYLRGRWSRSSSFD